MKRTMLVALTALAAGAAAAQGEAGKDPAKPEAAAPPLQYQSAFEDFRPFQEQEVASWREVNDEVARVGGHVGVLKSGKESRGAAGPKEENGSGQGKTMHGHERLHGGAK